MGIKESLIKFTKNIFRKLRKNENFEEEWEEYAPETSNYRFPSPS